MIKRKIKGTVLKSFIILAVFMMLLENIPINNICVDSSKAAGVEI